MKNELSQLWLQLVTFWYKLLADLNAYWLDVKGRLLNLYAQIDTTLLGNRAVQVVLVLGAIALCAYVHGRRTHAIQKSVEGVLFTGVLALLLCAMAGGLTLLAIVEIIGAILRNLVNFILFGFALLGYVLIWAKGYYHRQRAGRSEVNFTYTEVVLQVVAIVLTKVSVVLHRSRILRRPLRTNEAFVVIHRALGFMGLEIVQVHTK